MYGYVEPIKKELVCSEFVLYKSHYCGMCKNLGKQFGQLPRLTTSYDITFLSVLLSAYCGDNLSYNKERCILNPFKKKPRVLTTPLLKDIARASLILSYYKALDGVIDKDGAKYKLLKSMLKSASKKATKALPQIEQVVKLNYDRLRDLEKHKCTSIDRLADCFAIMLRDVVGVLIELQEERVVNSGIDRPCYTNSGRLIPQATQAPIKAVSFKSANKCYTGKRKGGYQPPARSVNLEDNQSTQQFRNPKFEFRVKKDNDELLSLCYNIGKFVYLIDALDDIEKDFKKNRPNPFLFSSEFKEDFTKKNTKQNFITSNKEKLEFIFALTVNRTIESFNNILHRFSGDDVLGLLQNIIYKGLRDKVSSIIIRNSEFGI